MKNSERNLNVINNFIDHWTSDDSERERMYKVASGYIEEDHVDGKGNSEDHIVTFGAESSYEVEDEDREYPEQVVVVADFGEEEGTQTACFIESTDVKGVNNLLEYIKDPYGKKI
jgi:hypothetical protein